MLVLLLGSILVKVLKLILRNNLHLLEKNLVEIANITRFSIALMSKLVIVAWII